MTIEQSVDTREATTMAQITERLCVRFPSVEPGEIELLVQLRYDGFAGSRIRDYVPILVERAAGDELRGRTR
ncbi:MAG TPA: hypothetical protein VMB79_09080 [Jatrophihabitans sp.]|nr:hypothetical protein [Jatrophihabitans sp.]